MREDDSNQIGDDLINDIQNQAQNQAKNQVRKITNKGTGMLKSAIASGGKKLAGKAIQAIGSLIKQLIALLIKVIVAISPYLLIIIVIVGILFLAWQFIVEDRGSESRYDTYEKNEQNTDNGYFTGDNVNAENRAIAQFYKYFSNNAYYQLLVDENGNAIDTELKKPDINNPIIDFYEKEKLFYIPDNLLLMIDDTLFDGKIRFPEQYIKPVKYNKETFELEQLTSNTENGDRVLSEDTLSMNYDAETGKTESGEVVGVWDYGLAPIYKYRTSEKWENVEGQIIGKEEIVYDNDNPANTTTRWVNYSESDYEDFELERPGSRESIHLMTSAVTFSGNFSWTYTFDEEKMGQKKYQLLEGESSNNESDPTEFYIYDTEEIWDYKNFTVFSSLPKKYDAETQTYIDMTETELWDFFSMSYSDLISVDVVTYQDLGFSPPPGYPVYKFARIEYRTYELIKTIQLRERRQGYVVEYAPRLESENKEVGGKDYFYDYLNNFQTWVPKSFTEDINFEDRIGQIVSVTLNVGSKATAFNKYLQEANNISSLITESEEIDKDMIVAIIAYDLAERSKQGVTSSEKDVDGITNIGKNAYTDSWNESYGGMSITKESRSDDATMIKFAGNKMKALNTKYQDPLVALLAYNWGETAVDTFKAWYPTEFSGTINWLDYRDEFADEFFSADNPQPSNYNYSFIEDVLAYYDGNLGYDQLLNHDKETVWEKIWGAITDVFTGVASEDFSDVEKVFYSRNLNNEEIDRLVKMSLTFNGNQNIKYSDVTDDMIPYFKIEYTSTGKYTNLTLEEAQSILPNLGSYASPVGNVTPIVTSPFGWRNIGDGNEFHRGIDISVPIGTKIYSILGGKVLFRGSLGTYGNVIMIVHDDGTMSVYAHLDDFMQGVDKETIVETGQLIAFSGNTGRSTGPHLHFEIRINAQQSNEEYIDPYYIFNNRSTAENNISNESNE